MPFQLSQLAAPVAEPITLADARGYLRLDDTTEDALVADLIAAARQHIERATGRSLMQQDWRIEWDLPQADCVALLRGPVTQLLAVSAIDAQGNAVVLSSDRYTLIGDRLRLHAGVSAVRLRVDYRAGVATAQEVPAPLRQALRAAVLCFYEARDASGSFSAAYGSAAHEPDAFGALVAPYRLLSL